PTITTDAPGRGGRRRAVRDPALGCLPLRATRTHERSATMNQRFFPDAAIPSGPVAPLAEGGTTADVEHPEGLLAGAGGAEIYWQAWLPSGEPRALVVIAHGIGEHSGRYGHVAARLNAAGFAAYALDHRGHGRSSGPRGLIDRMDHAVSDVDSFVTLAAARHADRPLHLLGHSMGGAIAIAYALRHRGRCHDRGFCGRGAGPARAAAGHGRHR